ncbi:Rrf2 family transcriptional regulator [Enterobacter hormaechei]|uniref:RrF2 family transcriptional regulator n=1 Tax=Enterobacter hormaechei TaxID=158836 RepID=UPI002A763C35|nr:Rrf2 family transcriptional regulator [Enterobacter hormaechei]MDY3570253.1 Rrf2 family transcriptional regulator [Enterobacter hormaechei]
MKKLQRTTVTIALMRQLVREYKGAPVPLNQLCKNTWSLSYLEQAVVFLRRAGLVVSTRGPGGGYSPARDNITLGDVVRSMSPGGWAEIPVVLRALDDIALEDMPEEEEV